LFGWNRSGGDLRVAHFFGLHAQQAIPLLGGVLLSLERRPAWIVLIAGSLCYAALTVVVFVQALNGSPFP
jgi:hypothetical protein